MPNDQGQELLRLFTGPEYSRKSLQNIQASFQQARSVVGDYAGLVPGRGYEFWFKPSPHVPVATTRAPQIPMMISLESPELYPTGVTETREIPSPQTAQVSLTGFDERYKANSGQATKTIEQVVNVTPSTSIEVEVPVFDAALGTQGSQRLAAAAHLRNLQERYETFQQASRSSRIAINDLNQPISGAGKRERRDPFGRNNSIKRAREMTVKDHLDMLKQQAEYLRNLPPMFMYVNPNSFSKSYDKIVSDANIARDGETIEFWGEQQATISASGTIGAFYVDANNRLGKKTGGLAVASRRGSYAYQQFMALFQIYRNNGYLYNYDERISLVGGVKIFYDGVVYTGSFDSFSISQTQDKAFTFTYSFQFTVRAEHSIR